MDNQKYFVGQQLNLKLHGFNSFKDTKPPVGYKDSDVATILHVAIEGNTIFILAANKNWHGHNGSPDDDFSECDSIEELSELRKNDHGWHFSKNI